METLGIVLVGILIVGILLYGRRKLIEARDDRILRRDLQRRKDAGKDGFCPVGFDSDGEWFSVRRLPKTGGDRINRTDIPDFLKK